MAYRRHNVRVNNSYAAFDLATLITDDLASEHWVETFTELQHKFNTGMKRRSDSSRSDGMWQNDASDKRPRLVPTPPPVPPPRSADTAELAVTEWMTSEHFHIADGLKLDNEALRALRRLHDAAFDEYVIFMQKLEDKLTETNQHKRLKKPSNFVITCVQNAICKL